MFFSGEQYAHLALSRLAAHAAEAFDERESRVRRGAEHPPTPDELAAWHEPFFESHAAPPEPEPPRLPPQLASDLTADERLLESLASVGFCALGGVVWGALRGLTPSSRAKRSALRAVGTTALGAGLFEALMLCKVSVREHLPSALGGGSGNFSTTARFANFAALDVLLSAQVLALVIRGVRSPFLFGGWLLGRSVILASDLIDVELEFMDY